MPNLLAVFMFGASLVAYQDRPVETPWADLEGELRQQGKPTDVVSLVRLAGSEREETVVRWMAIEILSLRRESSAHDVLADVLKRAEPALLREGAAIALGRLGDPAGVAALAAFVETAAQPDRRLVLAARLAELGSAGGYTHVKAAAAPDAPERSRVLAVGALVPFLPIESKANAVGATDLFLGLLKDESASVRREVLLYLPFAVEKGLALERVRPLAAKVARDDPDATVKESATLLIVAWDEQQHRASK